MLNIYYGEMPEAIYNTSVYFNNTYLDSWLEDEFVQRMIKSIDKSVVLGNGVIKSPVLGLIAPTQISGGLKTLILIHKDREKIFNASTCGDNCAWWILRMASKRDITINLRHLMDFGRGRFTVRVLNSGNIAHSMEDLIGEAYDALRGSGQ